MRKIISALLIIALCISLASCGANKKAFEASKAAYNNIDIAYEITEQLGSDIYEAWLMGMYEQEEILDGGCNYFSKELSISEDEVRAGVANFCYKLAGIEWEGLSVEEIQNVKDNADEFFNYFDDKFFSSCVNVVIFSYIANGNIDIAQSALDEAKTQMKELSENYSDYEHYPNLKGYYSTTASFLKFCQEPDGNFDQIQLTINDYRNKARDYISDLDYIFEE